MSRAGRCSTRPAWPLMRQWTARASRSHVPRSPPGTSSAGGWSAVCAALPVPYAYWIVCPKTTAKLPKIVAFSNWLLAEAAEDLGICRS